MAKSTPPVILDADKLERAEQYKSEGNECHKNKNIRRAIGKYHRALIQLKAIGQSKSSGLGALLSEADMEQLGHSSKISPEMQSEVSKLMADCYNNLAACLLLQENPNYEKIVDYCDNVLQINPENIKAYYRKGLCLSNLKEYQKALQCFEQVAGASKGCPDQALVQMKLCRERIKEQDEQLKSTYRSMFNQSASNG